MLSAYPEIGRTIAACARIEQLDDRRMFMCVIQDKRLHESPSIEPNVHRRAVRGK